MLGTAIRCVSMYSESWTTERGSTTEARDFVERFPLVFVRLVRYGLVIPDREMSGVCAGLVGKEHTFACVEVSLRYS